MPKQPLNEPDLDLLAREKSRYSVAEAVFAHQAGASVGTRVNIEKAEPRLNVGHKGGTGDCAAELVREERDVN